MKGFTLLELIIVLAIIGILAFIAIPTSCGYPPSTRISQTIASAEPVKTAISQYFQKYNTMPTSIAKTNLDVTKKDYLDSVSYLKYTTHSAVIIFQFNQKLGYFVKTNHKTLILKVTANADGTLSWDCRGGDLAAQYRPKACRRES